MLLPLFTPCRRFFHADCWPTLFSLLSAISIIFAADVFGLLMLLLTPPFDFDVTAAEDAAIYATPCAQRDSSVRERNVLIDCFRHAADAIFFASFRPPRLIFRRFRFVTRCHALTPRFTFDYFRLDDITPIAFCAARAARYDIRYMLRVRDARMLRNDMLHARRGSAA
jgi:hypothetical protein